MSYILIVAASVPLFLMFNKIFNNRKITSIEIIKLNKNSQYRVIGFMYFVSFIIFLSSSILDSQNIYNLLKVEYLVFYQGTIPFNLFMTIFSFCYSIYYFYLWLQNDMIYETGVFANGSIIHWHEVIDYKWSNVYEKKLFHKGKYFDLILTLPNIFALEREYKLIVNYDDRELVDDIFKKYANKEK